ncbi:unnamed protein product [Peronospora destructor]|uniref:Uncharacterized protein n=1 Tax=Peronospora destructor TaxID=86335 RepID=A0AAV0VED4_9STRA|nr:unnamed protein product [Peronospora destructor]
MIPFRTEFVGDTTPNWERVAVESPDGGHALVTFPVRYPFELHAKLIRRLAGKQWPSCSPAQLVDVPCSPLFDPSGDSCDPPSDAADPEIPGQNRV